MCAFGEEGQGLVEYSMIIALIAIAIILGLTLFGTSLQSYYQSIAAALPT
jgi:pilus assembly protein Flp/PilA